MKIKTRVGAVLVFAIAAVALLVPTAQAGSQPLKRGVSDFGLRFDQAVATTTMQDAHQRVEIVSRHRQLGGLDTHERALPPTSTPVPTGTAVSDTGFDWGDAAVGASSAFALALLIGISLVSARHYRSRPLPR